MNQPTAFYACAAPNAPMRSSWPFPASGVASARPVAPGVWWRPPLTWSITFIPRVPVRQWVLSFPIPLRVLFAAHPELLTRALRIAHRVIATFLIKQAGLKRAEAATGAVTLIQRFGSAANLNIHLHCLVLDGVYRVIKGVPVFMPCAPPPPKSCRPYSFVSSSGS